MSLNQLYSGIGPTMAGKTLLIMEMLKHRKQLFTTEFDRIFYFMPMNLRSQQDDFIKKLEAVVPRIQIEHSAPKIEMFNYSNLAKLIVLDDMMGQIFTDQEYEDLFTQYSHHTSLSIIFTSQNYFAAKASRTIMRQLPYKIIFNDRGQPSYIESISKQITGKTQALPEIFRRLEKECDDENPVLIQPYVLHDSHPNSPLRMYTLRTGILPNEDGKIIPRIFEL